MLPADLTDFVDLFARIIRIFVGMAFIATFVVLVWSGFQFLISGGDAKAIQTAKQSTIWALVGLLFLVIAWLILQLVHIFTGVDVTKFCISFDPCP